MRWEEHLPAGTLLTTMEQLAGYPRKSSTWPATFGLACCAMELISTAVQGVDHIVPVDIYLPGCPPRPEQQPWNLQPLNLSQPRASSRIGSGAMRRFS